MPETRAKRTEKTILHKRDFGARMISQRPNTNQNKNG